MTRTSFNANTAFPIVVLLALTLLAAAVLALAAGRAAPDTGALEHAPAVTADDAFRHQGLLNGGERRRAADGAAQGEAQADLLNGAERLVRGDSAAAAGPTESAAPTWRERAGGI